MREKIENPLAAMGIDVIPFNSSDPYEVAKNIVGKAYQIQSKHLDKEETLKSAKMNSALIVSELIWCLEDLGARSRAGFYTEVRKYIPKISL